MWRAWGIALLVLSQDLAGPFAVEEHEFSIRPPAGWAGRPARAPSVVKFLKPGEDGKTEADLLVTHLISGNPTPPAAWQAQAKEHVKTTYPKAALLEDRLFELGGRPAHLLAWSQEGKVQLKLGILRTNLEWYAVDASYPEAQAAAIRPLVDASAASLRIVPTALSADEKAAHARTLAFMRKATLDPSLKGDRWYAIQLAARKMGHQRVRIDESEGLVTFEVDTVLDAGEGGRDVSSVRGSFSPDLRVQKVETEQVKQDGKEKWTWRASVSLDAGKVRALREMNGIKEEKSFSVDEGTVFGDVVDPYRSFLAGAGRNTWFLRTLSAFADEPNTELLEVGARERVKIDGVEQDVVLVLSQIDRRKTLTNAYGADLRLLRMGGANEPLALKLVTKEEALAK